VSPSPSSGLVWGTQQPAGAGWAGSLLHPSSCAGRQAARLLAPALLEAGTRRTACTVLTLVHSPTPTLALTLPNPNPGPDPP